jgi:hypothetical protein
VYEAMPYSKESASDDATDARQRPVDVAPRPRVIKSNRELASEAGVSLRTFYRMRKDSNRCRSQKPAARLTAQILAELGHPELLGTDAHHYFEDFLAEFAKRMAALHDESPQAIEVRLARHNARMVVDALQRWQARRAKIYEDMLRQDKTDLFGFRG